MTEETCEILLTRYIRAQVPSVRSQYFVWLATGQRGFSRSWVRRCVKGGGNTLKMCVYSSCSGRKKFCWFFFSFPFFRGRVSIPMKLEHNLAKTRGTGSAKKPPVLSTDRPHSCSSLLGRWLCSRDLEQGRAGHSGSAVCWLQPAALFRLCQGSRSARRDELLCYTCDACTRSSITEPFHLPRFSAQTQSSTECYLSALIPSSGDRWGCCPFSGTHRAWTRTAAALLKGWGFSEPKPGKPMAGDEREAWSSQDICLCFKGSEYRPRLWGKKQSQCEVTLLPCREWLT